MFTVRELNDVLLTIVVNFLLSFFTLAHIGLQHFISFTQADGCVERQLQHYEYEMPVITSVYVRLHCIEVLEVDKIILSRKVFDPYYDTCHNIEHVYSNQRNICTSHNAVFVIYH